MFNSSLPTVWNFLSNEIIKYETLPTFKSALTNHCKVLMLYFSEIFNYYLLISSNFYYMYYFPT